MKKTITLLEEIFQWSKKLDSELAEVNYQCLNRVLQSKVLSFDKVPSYSYTKTCGFAIRSQDIEKLPIELNKVEFNNETTIHQGECVFVVDGDPIPKGADSVVKQSDYIDIKDHIIVNEFNIVENNIVETGIDIGYSDILIKEGTIIKEQHIALCKLCNVKTINIKKKPQFTLISYSDDIIESSEDIVHKTQKKIQNIINEHIENYISNLGGETKILKKLFKKFDIKDYIKSQHLNENEFDVLIITYLHNSNEFDEIFKTLKNESSEFKEIDFKIPNIRSIWSFKIFDRLVFLMPQCFSTSVFASMLIYKNLIHYLNNDILDIKTSHAHLSRNLDIYDRNFNFLYGEFFKNEQKKHIVTPFSGQDYSSVLNTIKFNSLISLDNKGKTIDQDGIVDIIIL